MWYIAVLAAGFLITSLIADGVRNQRIKRLYAESKISLQELRSETAAVLRQLEKVAQQCSEKTNEKTAALEGTGVFDYQEPVGFADSTEYKPFIELSLYVGGEYKLPNGRKTRAHGREETFPIRTYDDWAAAQSEIDKIIATSRRRSAHLRQARVS